jgi:hypothetical protein
MFCPAVFLLYFTPDYLVESSIDRRELPKRFARWDRIGLFQLRVGNVDRPVLLYVEDTDSIAMKEMKKGEGGVFTYPNFFDVHALCKNAKGKWVHQTVFGYARVQFVNVEEVARDHVVFKCRPNFMIDLSRDRRRPEDVNKPFLKRIAFEGGVLTAK